MQYENKRAILCGAWDSRGVKFAVGSGFTIDYLINLKKLFNLTITLKKGNHKLYLALWEEDNKWWFGH